MKNQLRLLKPFGVCVQANSESADVRELDIGFLGELFLRHQLVLLRGFNTFETAETFSDYCERWGEISIWPFGKVLELVEHDNPSDHIFDHSYVPLHWDGMYRPYVPEYQIFHCVRAPLSGYGGRTTFSNTILALKSAPADLKEFWYRVQGEYRRKMEFYDSKTVSPIVAKHPFRDFSVIRYSEPALADRGRLVNPPELHFKGVAREELESFHQNLRSVLYSPKNFYAHEWKDRDIVITDNFSLLHGREGFISKSPRHLQRVQVLSNPPLLNPGLEYHQ